MGVDGYGDNAAGKYGGGQIIAHSGKIFRTTSYIPSYKCTWCDSIAKLPESLRAGVLHRKK